MAIARLAKHVSVKTPLGTEQVSCSRKEEAEETQPSKAEAPHDGQDFSLGNQTLNIVFVRL
jgi:hypothetical protein